MGCMLELDALVADAIGPEQLAGMAVAALIDEVKLSPKPGLVDVRGRGAHADLDCALMCRSARVLEPTFAALAQAGRQAVVSLALRETVGAIGRQGEAAMLAATGGVNTHRGAIWALGLIVSAAAMGPGDAAAIAARAGALARLPDRHAPASTGHKGEQACRSFGVGGARGQAQAGFPHVMDMALPALHASRRRGDPEPAARLNALLAVMAELDDTCVLSRGGTAALACVQQGAARVLAAGGLAHADGREALARLDGALLAHNISPGGAADLLAVALFLDRLAQAGRR